MSDQASHLNDLRSRSSRIPAEVRQVLLGLAHSGTNAQTLNDWYQDCRALVHFERASPEPTNHVSSPPVDSLTSPGTSLASPFAPTSAGSPFRCPTCWEEFKNARDCKKHVHGHWLTFICPIAGCNVSDKRNYKVEKHLREGHADVYVAHVKPVKTVTYHWQALSCGYCQMLFQITPLAGDPLHSTMSKTSNAYMTHIFAHFKEGKSKQDWSFVGEAKGLLRQPDIAAIWDMLCSWRFDNPDPAAWPEFHWIEETAQPFIQSMQQGASVVDPWEYLHELLEGLCASRPNQMQPTTSGFAEPAPAEQCVTSDGNLNPEFNNELSDSSTFPLDYMMAYSHSCYPNVLPASSGFTPSAATGSTVVVQHEDSNTEAKYDSPLPLSLDCLSDFGHEMDLTALSGYYGLHMVDSQPNGELESMPDLPAAQDQPPLPHRPQAVISELEVSQSDSRMASQTMATEQAADSLAGVQFGSMPAYPPFNPTPPLPWHRGQKRTRSSLDHIKRISGGWFRRR